jgi:hypothetical protein
MYFEFESFLSEDEGSEEEEGEDDEDHYGDDSDEDEGEEEDVEVGGDYDQVEDEYDDYDEGEDEEYDEDEENEDDEEYDEEEGEEEGSNFDIIQPKPQSLFSNFKQPPQQPKSGTNLFTSMINNNFLLTTIQPFDSFVITPNIENLKLIDQACLESVLAHSKCSGSFIMRFIAHLSKIYDPKNTEDSKLALNSASYLLKGYVKKLPNSNILGDEILTEFGFLKSEEKSFRPLEMNKYLYTFLLDISKQDFFPSSVKKYITDYVSLRNQTLTPAMFNSTFKEKSDTFIKCFS